MGNLSSIGIFFIIKPTEVININKTAGKNPLCQASSKVLGDVKVSYSQDFFPLKFLLGRIPLLPSILPVLSWGSWSWGSCSLCLDSSVRRWVSGLRSAGLLSLPPPWRPLTTSGLLNSTRRKINNIHQNKRSRLPEPLEDSPRVAERSFVLVNHCWFWGRQRLFCRRSSDYRQPEPKVRSRTTEIK